MNPKPTRPVVKRGGEGAWDYDQAPYYTRKAQRFWHDVDPLIRFFRWLLGIK